MELRRKNQLPPFERFIAIILSGKKEIKVESLAINLIQTLEKKLDAKILGPVVAPIPKIKNNYRYRILIRSKKSQKIQKNLSLILNKFKKQNEIKLVVDVDPISFN